MKVVGKFVCFKCKFYDDNYNNINKKIEEHKHENPDDVFFALEPEFVFANKYISIAALEHVVSVTPIYENNADIEQWVKSDYSEILLPHGEAIEVLAEAETIVEFLNKLFGYKTE